LWTQREGSPKDRGNSKRSVPMQSKFSEKDGSLMTPQTEIHRMFDVISKTWNPVIGCLHSCSYCWARRLVVTRLKNSEKYRDGFTPKLVEKELRRKFHDQFVFVSDMGDLFGDWVPSEWIIKVVDAVRQSPSSTFLFLTKNPRRYSEFLDLYPSNIVFGATIESNRDYSVSNAPSPSERYKSMADLPLEHKLVCIEPIMDFDMETFVQWIKEIEPSVVYVGYDNYNNKLPEPSKTKTEQLISQLSAFARVRTKF
jgi:DNA repair photolyase